MFADYAVRVGRHLSKHRLVHRLFQRDMTEVLDLCIHIYIDRENDRAVPPTRYFPNIIKLLGYVPCPVPMTLAEKLLYLRRLKGWKIVVAALHVGVDEGTWGHW